MMLVMFIAIHFLYYNMRCGFFIFGTCLVCCLCSFDWFSSTQVTETADFQKDLCLDSLDRVELVMAFEAEFNIEIPDEKADKLTCCADVAKYITETNFKMPEES